MIFYYKNNHKNLVSVVQNDDGIEGDVSHRTQVEWLKWRKPSWFYAIQKYCSSLMESFIVQLLDRRCCMGQNVGRHTQIR